MNHSKWYMRCHLKSLVCAILCVRAQFYAIVILFMDYFPFLLTIVADSEKITISTVPLYLMIIFLLPIIYIPFGRLLISVSTFRPSSV